MFFKLVSNNCQKLQVTLPNNSHLRQEIVRTETRNLRHIWQSVL